MIQLGEPFVSPLIRGSISNRQAVVVILPAKVGGEAGFALRAGVKREEIARVLNEQHWPSDWTASILDQNNVIVARSRDGERFIGQSAHPSLIEGMNAGKTQFEALTKDGLRTVVSVADIPGTRWHVAVGRPAEAVLNEAWSSMLLVVGVGLACAGLSLVASRYLSQAIARQVRAVADAHTSDEPAGTALASVKEVSDLSAAWNESRNKAAQAAAALHSAKLDALTGLPGRSLFMEQAQNLLAGAASLERGVALLFIDLDGFKQVNDELGHDEGDRVLKSVAAVLIRCVRSEDVVGRIGGDEFLVCVRAPQDRLKEIALGAAARIVEGVGAIGHGIGCSVGTAFAHKAEHLPTLIDAADKAMLTSKLAGKGRVTVAA